MADVPRGLDVQFSDRGFVLKVKAPGRFGWLGSLILPALAFGVIGVVSLSGGLAQVGWSLIASVAIGVGVSGAIGLLWWRMKNPATALTLDGNALTLPTLDGEVTVQLGDVKGIDRVPVGLAVRRRGGPTVIVVLRGVHAKGTRWLEHMLESARARHGTQTEVPPELAALEQRVES